MKVFANPDLIQSGEQVRELAEKLRSEKIISFDTEFIRETTFFPVVEIIQVSTDKESWIVDAKAFKHKSSDPKALQPLLDIFEDPSILKILHAAQGDQECLYTSFGVVATPTLDTSVAASLCGYGEAVGLGNLLKSVLNVQIKKGHARTDWSVRPLPPQLAEYAHADVEHLVELGVKLMEQLEKLGRKEWALELSAKWEEKKLYQANPEETAQKLARGGRLDKRGYSALIELVRWREERVRVLNLPRRWVADDNVLMDLAHVRPKDITHLSAFRGLNKGELKNSGDAILAALNRANDAQDVVLPKLPKSDVANEAESQVLDLMKCYVGILADRLRIASKHLLTASQFLPVLRSKAKSAQDLVKAGILTEGAAHLIGEEMVALIQGRRALSINGTQIKIVELDREGVAGAAPSTAPVVG